MPAVEGLSPLDFATISLDTMRQMAGVSVGATLLPALCVRAEARQDPQIVLKPLTEPSPSRTIGLVWRQETVAGDAYRMKRPSAPCTAHTIAGQALPLGCLMIGANRSPLHPAGSAKPRAQLRLDKRSGRRSRCRPDPMRSRPVCFCTVRRRRPGEILAPIVKAPVAQLL